MGIAAFAAYRLAAPRLAPALVALLVLQPKWVFLVEQSWTEPLLLAGIAGMVWATASGRTKIAVLALAGALAMKQHMLLLVPLAAWWPAFGPRRALVSMGVAALVVVPFLVADPAAFVADAFRFHLDLAPRSDALSLSAMLLAHGRVVPFAVVVAGTVAAWAMAMALPRDAAGFVLGSAWVLLVFNLLNKQSFFNHYSLVLWLLALAAAVMSRSPEHDPPATPPAPARAVSPPVSG
jgi:hypothetical protein